MSLASLVKELRERTGAGMMDCKKALEASNNNMDGAIDWLRGQNSSETAFLIAISSVSWGIVI